MRNGRRRVGWRPAQRLKARPPAHSVSSTTHRTRLTEKEHREGEAGELSVGAGGGGAQPPRRYSNPNGHLQGASHAPRESTKKARSAVLNVR
jgi:hypothetical protein